MTRHTDRLNRRQQATDELQQRIAARNTTFDALDALDAALEAAAGAAGGDSDPLTRAERLTAAVAKVDDASRELRNRAEQLRHAEGTKPADVATLLGVPASKLFPRPATTSSGPTPLPNPVAPSA